MEIDYKIEREKINLEEFGSDQESPKYKQIQKRIQILKKSRDEKEVRDGIELIRSRSSSSSDGQDDENLDERDEIDISLDFLDNEFS